MKIKGRKMKRLITGLCFGWAVLGLQPNSTATGLCIAGEPITTTSTKVNHPPTVASDDVPKDSWLQWRGPNKNGSAMDSKPPTQWSESKNIKWKSEIPGKGSSTPIIYQDRIYILTAIQTNKEGLPPNPDTQQPNVALGDESADAAGRRNRPASSSAGAARERPGPPLGPPPGRPGAQGPRQERGGEQGRPRPGGRQSGGRQSGGRQGGGGGRAPTLVHDFIVLCYDKSSGKELWRKTLAQEVPHESGHNTNNFASSSPLIADGKLYVYFGSRGLFCLDLEGQELWKKDFGQMQTRNSFGEGSTPAVYKGMVVVPWDHEGDSFIVALDATDGNELWRTARDERTTWSTPLIEEFNGKAQVITNGTKVRSYDLSTGALIWECGGQVMNPIPSPVRQGDNVVCMTGYQGYAIVSMPLNAKGDITDSKDVTWKGGGAAPYVPSPLLYDGMLYFNKSNNAVMVARDATTGEVIIEETRMPGLKSVYSSPVGANGNVYFCSREGVTLVLKHGKTFEVIATNDLGETIDSSPAIVGNEIFIRGEKHLFCIAEE